LVSEQQRGVHAQGRAGATGSAVMGSTTKLAKSTKFKQPSFAILTRPFCDVRFLSVFYFRSFRSFRCSPNPRDATHPPSPTPRSTSPGRGGRTRTSRCHR
jgi:hypothetical protein